MEALIIEIDFEYYYNRILEGNPFQQANFGDGEWQTILGWIGKTNSDHITYTKEMQEVLSKTLTDSRFTFVGTNCGVKILEDVKTWIKENKCTDLPWVYKETITNANCNGHIGRLFKLFRERDVVLVGGEHLRNLDLFPNATFVEVPRYGAFELYEKIGDRVHRVSNEKSIVLFSAGFMTNACEWYMLKEYPEMRNNFMIDMGAIFDPYVGVYSRSAYKKAKWQNEIMPKNLRDMQ